ncbi:hypothetical protein IscW_ISCW009335 [Ixodes scapularis]|uniref:Uncharacterized protein n=1 Tax=Ixodes scapularis TaxID=6945 RepID=B7Q2A8_IXOSC|nr:hypothetical protein IscW_ISCW009335 [Ixodes scapularis]|eukprot:XP_002410639.1 hypothetical protein IscW_ISCW009335 [Ixodes scapularis]
MDTTEAEDAQGTGEPVTPAGSTTTTPPTSQDAQVPGDLGRQADAAIAVSEDKPVKGNVSCSFAEDSVLSQTPAPSTGQDHPAKRGRQAGSHRGRSCGEGGVQQSRGAAAQSGSFATARAATEVEP